MFFPDRAHPTLNKQTNKQTKEKQLRLEVHDNPSHAHDPTARGNSTAEQQQQQRTGSALNQLVFPH